MNEFQTYELTTHQKLHGTLMLKRVALIFIYIAYAIGALVLGTLARIIVPLLALVPISLWIIIFFTWRYTYVDYECSMTSGFITFSKIYGSRSRKKVFETQIKGMSLIAPYTDEYFERVRAYSPEVEYYALSSPDAERAYFALFENADGKKSIFIFEADKRSLSIFKFYNPSSTVIERSII